MQVARRTENFTESVIRGMTRLAREHDAINLAQGFPNFAAPAVLKEAAARAIHDDVNQYAVTWGPNGCGISSRRNTPPGMAWRSIRSGS